MRAEHAGRRLGAAVLAVGSAVALVEMLNRRAFRSNAVPDKWPRGVVVLGHPSRKDGAPHLIQRWRVQAGVRVFRERGAESTIDSDSARNTRAKARRHFVLGSTNALHGH